MIPPRIAEKDGIRIVIRILRWILRIFLDPPTTMVEPRICIRVVVGSRVLLLLKRGDLGRILLLHILDKLLYDEFITCLRIVRVIVVIVLVLLAAAGYCGCGTRPQTEFRVD